MLCHQRVELFDTLSMIRRCGSCGFLGTGMALLEDMGHLGVAFEVSRAHPMPSIALFFSPYKSGCSSQLLFQYMPGCYHDPCHNVNDQSLLNCVQTPNKILPCIEVTCLWCVFHAIEQTVREKLILSKLIKLKKHVLDKMLWGDTGRKFS